MTNHLLNLHIENVIIANRCITAEVVQFGEDVDHAISRLDFETWVDKNMRREWSDEVWGREGKMTWDEYYDLRDQFYRDIKDYIWEKIAGDMFDAIPNALKSIV